MLLLYILIATILWGVRPFLSKKILQELKSSDIFILRYFFALIFIGLILFLTKSKIFERIKKVSTKTWIYFVISTIIGVGGFFFYMHLIKNGSPIKITALINPLIIIMTTLWGIFVFKDKIKGIEIIGIILTIIGVFLLGFKNKSFENIEEIS